MRVHIDMAVLRAVLPVNLSQNRIKQEALTAADAVSTFSTLTLSNIPRGSGLYW